MTRIPAVILAGLLLAGSTPVFAQGKGGGRGGQHKTGPRDGSGKQEKGTKGEKGKKTGPRDGTGPIHPPGTGKQ